MDSFYLKSSSMKDEKYIWPFKTLQVFRMCLRRNEYTFFQSEIWFILDEIHLDLFGTENPSQLLFYHLTINPLICEAVTYPVYTRSMLILVQYGEEIEIDKNMII